MPQAGRSLGLVVVIDRHRPGGARNNPHASVGALARFWGQVDDIAGLDLEIDRDRGVGGGLDPREAEHEGAGAVADYFVIAVEQFAFDIAGARRIDDTMRSLHDRRAVLRAFRDFRPESRTR